MSEVKRTVEQVEKEMERCPDCIMARRDYYGCDGCYDHCKELEELAKEEK